ncbi:unnamed protein product [Pseudo-nitzschia multistriata]|uniref:Uncharacterized protein n=1 Tax=Pseudo-nitzschia multistriata TaxID=183589 RepID=A0A448YYS3_9STRA|nr:unnamed protein product [Pseudo-nitzschia multistriata]
MWAFFQTSNDDSRQTHAKIVVGCPKPNHAASTTNLDSAAWALLQEAVGTPTGTPHTGMQVPFGTKINPQTQRRQVFVSRDIPKGYELWKPIHYHTFHSEEGYTDFLREVPHNLRCAVLEWTHPSSHDNDIYVDVTLDEGTFIQEAELPEQVNIDIDCVALRDIKAGEFVYMNTTEHFSLSGDVEWLEAIRTDALKRTGLGSGRRRNQYLNNNHTHRLIPPNHTEDDTTVVAPVIAALSALYFVVKLVRGGNASKPYDFGCDYGGDCHNGCTFGSFFYGSQKTKIA